MDSLVYLVLDDQVRLLLLNEGNFEDDSSDYQRLEAAVTKFLEREEIFQLPYQKITISLPNLRSTFIPNRLYKEVDQKSYFSVLTNLTKAKVLETDELPTLSAKVVYEVDIALKTLLKGQFPSGKLYHPAIPLIEGYKQLTDSNEGFKFFVNVRDRQLQICLFENQHLLFYNTFSFIKANDAIYYILLVFDQFNLNPEETPLIVSGQILEKSEIFQLFYRYIENVNFVPKPDFLKFDKAFENTPVHLYFDLFALAGFVIR